MGVVHTCRAVIPVMRQAGKGLIITISSIGGVIAVPFQGFYSASKFAVEGYSEALLHEVRPFGIRICLVEPVISARTLLPTREHFFRNS